MPVHRLGVDGLDDEIPRLVAGVGGGAAPAADVVGRRPVRAFFDAGRLGVLPAARGSQLDDRQAGFFAEVAQPMDDGFQYGVGRRGQRGGQEVAAGAFCQWIWYWLWGTARDHTASNASAHSLAATGSSESSWPIMAPLSVKWPHRIRGCRRARSCCCAGRCPRCDSGGASGLARQRARSSRTAGT